MLREDDAELSSLAYTLAMGCDGAAVQFHQLLHDGKAKTQPFATALSLGLLKSLKDPWQALRSNAIAGVLNDKFYIISSVGDDRIHATAGRSELDRISQQVPRDLLQAVGVAKHCPYPIAGDVNLNILC
jgi:hypothetical protein